MLCPALSNYQTDLHSHEQWVWKRYSLLLTRYRLQDCRAKCILVASCPHVQATRVPNPLTIQTVMPIGVLAHHRESYRLKDNQNDEHDCLVVSRTLIVILNGISEHAGILNVQRFQISDCYYLLLVYKPVTIYRSILVIFHKWVEVALLGAYYVENFSTSSHLILNLC